MLIALIASLVLLPLQLGRRPLPGGSAADAGFVTGGYALASAIGTSGPIAIVCAGVLMGIKDASSP